MFLACYSIAYFSFCYVCSGCRVIIAAPVFSSLWVPGALPVSYYSVLATLLPGFIVPVYRGENQEDPV